MSVRKKRDSANKPILGNVYVFRLYVHLGSPLHQEKPLELRLLFSTATKTKPSCVCVPVCVCARVCTYLRVF